MPQVFVRGQERRKGRDEDARGEYSNGDNRV